LRGSGAFGIGERLAYSTRRERFLAVEEGVQPKHLAVPDLEDPADVLVELDAASAPARPDVPERDDRLAPLEELLRHEIPGLEVLVERGEPFARALVPTKRLAFEGVADRRFDLDIGIEQLERRVAVSCVPALEGRADQLDVRALCQSRASFVETLRRGVELRKRREAGTRLALVPGSAYDRSSLVAGCALSAAASGDGAQ
jgi:hypothetical protein